MLISVAKQDVDNLLGELDKRRVRHFEVGCVTKGTGLVTVLKDAKVIET